MQQGSLTFKYFGGMKRGYIYFLKIDTPMSLSDTTIKAAKPKPDKPYKLSDEKGLYLLINPNGAKYFRLKYRFAGKEKILALGMKIK
ncbi:MAG: Arm DNA-binding domain-containing protein [Methylococcales bacterium]